MNREHLTYLCACASCVILLSCHKTDSKPAGTTTPPPTVGTMNINFDYGPQGSQYELIISEPGGTVLLDTLAVGAVPVIATLKTNDTLVDLTTIISLGSSYYDIYCYKSINASRITTPPSSDYTIADGLKTGTTTPASIYYENIPQGALTNTLSPQFLFTNFPWNVFTNAVTSVSPNYVSINYNNYAGNYAYFLLPSAGLYNLHIQVNAADTVDCTHMDTAISLTFNRPQPFTVNSQLSTFIGIPDTTDLTKIIGFTYFNAAPPSRAGVDFEYPNIPVQKYELDVLATNANNDNMSYYYLGDSIPLTLPFFQESDFSVTSTVNTNFTVSFPNTQPTYYATSWRDSSLVMVIYSPADSGTQHPLALLTNQNPKLLKGFNFNAFALGQFTIANINGMSYNGWLNYKSTPLSFATTLLKAY
jgi:hypothetical protein